MDPRRRVALCAVKLSTNNYPQTLHHTRYASGSAGIILRDRSLGAFFDSGILYLSLDTDPWRRLLSALLAHPWGYLSILNHGFLDHASPPLPTGDPSHRRQQWQSAMTWQPWLASRARRSYTVRRLRALTKRQLDCSFSLGCYTILFIVSIHLMLRRSHNRGCLNRPIFIMSILLYLSCSTHFALEFYHFYDVLVCTICRRSYAISEHSVVNYRRQEFRQRDEGARRRGSLHLSHGLHW